MEHSPTIAELTKALSAAQGKMDAAELTRKNPHFQNRYATLAAVWDAIRKPLADNGLAVFQTVDPSDDPALIVLSTLLSHSSGEWIKSTVSFRVAKLNPQEYGSALTYFRRYTLSAIVGAAPDDATEDDGNSASARDASRPAAQQSQQRPTGNQNGNGNGRPANGQRPTHQPGQAGKAQADAAPATPANPPAEAPNPKAVAFTTFRQKWEQWAKMPAGPDAPKANRDVMKEWALRTVSADPEAKWGDLEVEHFEWLTGEVARLQAAGETFPALATAGS